MTCRRFIPLAFLVVLVLAPPSLLHAAATDVRIAKDKGPVDIEADHLTYEKDEQVYEGHGNVEVTRGDFFLKADHARLKNATKELEAWGNVVLREGEDVLECQRLEVNLETQMGKVYQAKLFLKDQNFHITGREAEKLGENQYRVRDGSLTTCDAERPPWKFTAKELEVSLKGKGTAKGVRAYLENIPVLYLPVAVFPVKQERQTGFLFPGVGHSSRFGPEVKNTFFWAIAKDMDATLYLDWLGDRGFKEGLEYRFEFTEEAKAEARFYFIDDRVFDGDRYAFFVKHKQVFPNGLYLKGDINRTSDNRYLQDFDEDFLEEAKIDSRSLRQLRSVLFGGKNWDQFSFLVDARVFQDLTQESNDQTPQILPQASFNVHPQSLFETPLFYDVTASYSNFWREQGVKSHREDVLPRISYPMRLFNGLKLGSAVAFRETLYQPYDDPTGRLDKFKSRELFEAGIQMSTEFYRVYDAAVAPGISSAYKVDKWMHTIEPEVSYRYVPRVNQGDLPFFDEVDRIPFTSAVTYGITQRLVGRPDKKTIDSGPYEYGKLRVFQAYSFGDPLFVRDGKENRFSNIQAELWWNFKPNILARWDTEFDPSQGRFNGFNFLVNVKDARNDAIQIQYRSTGDSLRQVNLDEPPQPIQDQRKVRSINVDTRVRTIQDLYLYGGIRYNLLERTRVESIYGAEYQAQCWTLAVTIEDRNRSPEGTQRKDLRYQVFFNLLGFGAAGQKSYLMKM
jgi:LPS-assembly protein